MNTEVAYTTTVGTVVVWIFGDGPTLHEGSACSRVAHDHKMQPSQSTPSPKIAQEEGTGPARSVRSRRRHYTFGIGGPLDSLANTVRTRPHHAHWPVRMAERLNVGVPNRMFAHAQINGHVGAAAQARRTTRGPFGGHHFVRARLGHATRGP